MKKQCIKSDATLLDRLYEIIMQRKAALSPDSYVASLFIKGTEKMHAKIAEESGELIEASEQGNREHIIHEAADLVFHTMVLLGQWDIQPGEIYGELARRWGVSGIQEKESRKAENEPIKAR
jgi:phosphoribosyl-ATP pyrophosphohydrolase